MYPDVKSVRYLQDYELELTFTDGVCGKVDLAPSIFGRGGVFKPLEDRDFFAQVKINPEIGTIVWPNDVDFDPEVLYSQITGKPIPSVAHQTSH
jgi:hypothetical protein